jgi:uncharacterized membrane protein YgdD (TMEM256/DUF423 family)
MKINIIRIAILFAISSIILGAFGAHGLKEHLTSVQLNSFLTGIRYQMYHSLALLLFTFNHEKFNKYLNYGLWIMIVGIILFSFSIYLLSTQNLTGLNTIFLGPVTPVGGLFLTFSWIIILFSIKNKEYN